MKEEVSVTITCICIISVIMHSLFITFCEWISDKR